MPEQRAGLVAQQMRPKLERFLDEVDLWRGRINLTTVPRDAAWERHVLETCSLLDATAPRHNAEVVDVGAGMGVPGVVMGMLRPDLRVTCIEADRR
ncbi:MAG: class I SAM-dependent methyltransferase, partial [Candidatus Dormibacteraeota bacterium]|nr:class I SAM-dependent methyltransferase [Candidatus Dormibacteraeota bacterium]